jgi:hypothetical protein
MADNPDGENASGTARRFHREAQDEYVAESVVPSRFHLVRAVGGIQHSATQHIRIFERNAKSREEDARFVAAFAMERVERVVFELGSKVCAMKLAGGSFIVCLRAWQRIAARQ